jgi:hypothetical protein
MSIALAGPAISISNTILSYFNPSKSPFYGVIAFGTTSLIMSCQEIESSLWWAVAIPIWLVLAIAFLLSLNDRHVFEPGQHEDQLRFARSFCISSALLAVVLTARQVDQNLSMFWTSYAFCFVQVLVFLLYAWARSRTEEPVAMNFVQFALITCSLLIGASYALGSYAIAMEETDADAAVAGNALEFLYAATGLYALWSLCIIRWIRHLLTLIVIQIPQQAPAITPKEGNDASG